MFDAAPVSASVSAGSSVFSASSSSSSAGSSASSALDDDDYATLLQKLANVPAAANLLRETAEKAWQQPVKQEELEPYMQRYRAGIYQGQAFVDAVMEACKGIWTDPRYAARFVREAASILDRSVRPDELADYMQRYKAYCDAGDSWQTAMGKVSDAWHEANCMEI